MAYSVDYMASQRTLRPKREVNWRKLHFGEDFPTENQDLQEQHFQTRLKYIPGLGYIFKRFFFLLEAF
jgi:hypothetical protein